MKKTIIILTIGLALTGCGNAEQASENRQVEVEEATLPAEEKLLEAEIENNQVQNQEVDTPVNKEDLDLDPSEEINNSAVVQVIAKPADLLVLVNKKNALPANYVPSNLVAPDVPFYFDGDDPKRYLRQEAAMALEELFAGATAENIEILGASGYRSYSRQEAIFAANVQRQGEEAARKVSAVAGQSEHQTGLAIDLTSHKVGFDLIEEFGETTEGIWLKENAHKYGFIIRYPKGKEHITGYSYEPWHIRYIGKDIAAEVYKMGLTLEEYFSAYPVNSSNQTGNNNGSEVDSNVLQQPSTTSSTIKIK